MVNSLFENADEVTEVEDPILKWEMLKVKIRSESMKFAAQNKRNRKNKINSLEDQIKHYENEIIGPLNYEDEMKFKNLKLELERELEYDTNGANLRSKVRWYEEGEKPSKYFFNLEKRNFNNKVINKLNVNDELINDPKEILREEKKFYENLYTSSNNVDIENEMPDIATFLDNTEAPKLSEQDKLKCEGELQEFELLNVLKNTANKKSPGSDGFPVEFYKVFWPQCKHFLLNALNTAYNRGLLSTTQRHGVITLLPKKDKDTLFLKNWRPISLLNQDYKLAAKCIAFRLKKVLSKLIHEDQTGFMEGRYIGENINRIINLMDFVDENNIPALLILVDFEKAFDHLEWSFIQNCLEFFNFGPSLQQWIKVLYTDIQSCVINNGWTESFFLSRGVISQYADDNSFTLLLMNTI